MKLHWLILIGMGLGALFGGWLNGYKPAAGEEAGWFYATTIWTLDLLGKTCFIGGLRMIFAPLILASIVAGVTSLPNVRELGSIGVKVFGFYLVTTTVAVTLGIVVVQMIAPGHRDASQARRVQEFKAQDELRARYSAYSGQDALQNDIPTPAYLNWLAGEKSTAAGDRAGADLARMTEAKDKTPGEIFREQIVAPVLKNPFESLADANALGIIFFAILIGVACAVVGSTADPVVSFFQGFNEVIMTITRWIMAISPLFIACLMAQLVAETGLEVFNALMWYCLTVVGGVMCHWAFLLTLAVLVGGIGPLAMVRGMSDAFLIAFTTRSSAATLPVTIRNVTENLGVSPKVANFALPIGATVNMDGTSLYLGVAVIFVIQLLGPRGAEPGLDDVPIVLDATRIFLIMITAVLASVGAAAVPSAGLVTMAIVATAVGLPLYHLVIIFAVDAILDMFRTVTNIFGDAVGAVVVNRLERGKLGVPTKR